MTGRRRRGDLAAAEWERYGEVDPYFGVLADDRFRRDRVDDATLDEFFASGETEIARVLDRLEQVFGTAPGTGAALDFGCGVGRLLFPLARRSATAYGVDIAESMRAQARRGAAERGLDGVTLLDTAELERVGPTLDLLTSVIVLQHIPPADGHPLIRRLARLLAPGGMAHLQITLSPGSPLAPAFYWTLRTVPGAAGVWNRTRRRPADHPIMEMNGYALERVLGDLRDEGIPDVHVEYAPAGAERVSFSHAVLRFRRPPA